MGAGGFDCEAVTVGPRNPERDGDDPGVDLTLHLARAPRPRRIDIPHLQFSVTYALTTERRR
jgi:hypothetical protein